MGLVTGAALTPAQIAHIRAVRGKVILGRTQSCVLYTQSNNPIASATPGLARPTTPAIQDAGPGGTFPGGNVYAQVIALNANGQTLPGPEAGPIATPPTTF